MGAAFYAPAPAVLSARSARARPSALVHRPRSRLLRRQPSIDPTPVRTRRERSERAKPAFGRPDKRGLARAGQLAYDDQSRSAGLFHGEIIPGMKRV